MEGIDLDGLAHTLELEATGNDFTSKYVAEQIASVDDSMFDFTADLELGAAGGVRGDKPVDELAAMMGALGNEFHVEEEESSVAVSGEDDLFADLNLDFEGTPSAGAEGSAGARAPPAVVPRAPPPAVAPRVGAPIPQLPVPSMGNEYPSQPMGQPMTQIFPGGPPPAVAPRQPMGQAAVGAPAPNSASPVVRGPPPPVAPPRSSVPVVPAQSDHLPEQPGPIEQLPPPPSFGANPDAQAAPFLPPPPAFDSAPDLPPPPSFESAESAGSPQFLPPAELPVGLPPPPAHFDEASTFMPPPAAGHTQLGGLPPPPAFEPEEPASNTQPMQDSNNMHMYGSVPPVMPAPPQVPVQGSTNAYAGPGDTLIPPPAPQRSAMLPPPGESVYGKAPMPQAPVQEETYGSMVAPMPAAGANPNNLTRPGGSGPGFAGRPGTPPQRSAMLPPPGESVYGKAPMPQAPVQEETYGNMVAPMPAAGANPNNLTQRGGLGPGVGGIGAPGFAGQPGTPPQRSAMLPPPGESVYGKAPMPQAPAQEETYGKMVAPMPAGANPNITHGGNVISGVPPGVQEIAIAGAGPPPIRGPGAFGPPPIRGPGAFGPPPGHQQSPMQPSAGGSTYGKAPVPGLQVAPPLERGASWSPSGQVNQGSLAPAVQEFAPVLPPNATEAQYKEYMITKYEWEANQAKLGRLSPASKRLSANVSTDRLGVSSSSFLRLFVECPEKQLEIQNTTTPDKTVAEFRAKMCERMGVSELDSSFQLYVGSLQMEPHRQLRDYRLRASGEHLWFRQVAPYQPEQGDVELFSSRIPKEPTPNQRRLVIDLKLTPKDLSDKKMAAVLRNVVLEAFSLSDEHNPVKVKEPCVHNTTPYKVLKNPKKRDKSLRPFELERYLSKDEFKVVFGVDREDFHRYPPSQRWQLKRQLGLAL